MIVVLVRGVLRHTVGLFSPEAAARPVRRRVGGRQLSAVLFLKLRHPQRFCASLQPSSQHAAPLPLLVVVVVITVLVVTQRGAFSETLDGDKSDYWEGKLDCDVTGLTAR